MTCKLFKRALDALDALGPRRQSVVQDPSTLSDELCQAAYLAAWTATCAAARTPKEALQMLEVRVERIGLGVGQVAMCRNPQRISSAFFAALYAGIGGLCQVWQALSCFTSLAQGGGETKVLAHGSRSAEDARAQGVGGWPGWSLQEVFDRLRSPQCKPRCETLPMASYASAERVKQIFLQADEDRNGVLSKEEVKKVIQKLANWDDETVEELMKQCDYNKDGSLQIREFVDFLFRSTRKEGEETRGVPHGNAQSIL